MVSPRRTRTGSGARRTGGTRAERVGTPGATRTRRRVRSSASDGTWRLGASRGARTGPGLRRTTGHRTRRMGTTDRTRTSRSLRTTGHRTRRMGAAQRTWASSGTRPGCAGAGGL